MLPIMACLRFESELFPRRWNCSAMRFLLEEFKNREFSSAKDISCYKELSRVSCREELGSLAIVCLSPVMLISTFFLVIPVIFSNSSGFSPI